MRFKTVPVWLLINACAALAFGTDDASGPIWREDTYLAWKASQELGRPLLLFITSDNCPYCHLMDKNTFSDGRVIARLRQSFVAARVDSRQNPELTRQLQIRAFPTTVVVDPSNRVIGAIPGYLEPHEFERRLAQLAK